ncbi:SRPBCC domain-containing protein [Streptomyces sp. XM4193]|uniref:SRPBCC domain-containing protein n=1 Tax=Streptomyces sp. XM4193 TaxID=2929782 RepID=UPI001FF9E5F0|nr:SRPBCC domain-containing protein [Streptomyces sp. XM4193]MCK1794847.1 SRPBCC domain-containing protein [Streptomyces sp. XM4193]
MTLAEEINSVIRTVASSGAGHSVRLSKTFRTRPADLREAITSPERLARWFEPVEGELAPGGRYTLTDSGTTGTVESCERPDSLRITWEYGGESSLVRVTLTPEGDATVLTLVHEVPDNDHWAAYGPGATGIGWESSVRALSTELSTAPGAVGAEADRPDADEAAFIDAAADAWEEAHRASGASAEQAHRQARATAAAYRGE